LIEAFSPEALVAIEPFVGFFHRFSSKPAGDRAAGFVTRDEAGIRQHAEMLHHRGQRHRERFGEVAYRDVVSFAQARQ